MSATSITSAMKNQCAHCNAPTQVTCSGCSSKLGEEVQTPTYYCKKECQAAQWNTHKSACKAHQTKKLLYRAGETLQEIFYRYREVMFDTKIVKIEEKNGKLFLHEDYANRADELKILHDFPNNLVQKIEDKQAALAHMACSDAAACMQEVTEYLLTDKQRRVSSMQTIRINSDEGIVARVEEFTLDPKNAKREVVKVLLSGNYNPPCLHACFKIILKNGGGAYALDFTSAQYGYHYPITPWAQYVDHRVSRLRNSGSFGEAKNVFTMVIGGTVSSFDKLAKMNQGCSKVMKSSTVKWETETDMPISSFLTLPQKQFEQQQKEFCGFVADDLRSYQKRTLEQARKSSKKSSGTPKASFTNEEALMDSFWKLMNPGK